MKPLLPILIASFLVFGCGKVDTLTFVTDPAPADGEPMTDPMQTGDDPMTDPAQTDDDPGTVFDNDSITETHGRFKAVAAGDEFSCTLDASGNINCWGGNDWGRAEAPPGAFIEVAAGARSVCGVTTDRSIICWGLSGTAALPHGVFAHVSPADTGGCAVKLDGQILCWHEDQLVPAPEGEFEAVSITSLGTCGLRANGRVDCWPFGDSSITKSLAGTFTALLQDEKDAMCGLTEAGDVHCTWDVGDASVVGPFVQASGNSVNGCGILRDGSIRCWGSSEEIELPPSGKFVQLDVSNGAGSHACALREDGEVQCWGADYSGQATPPPVDPPPGEFAQVAVSNSSGCGVRGDGTTMCWGEDAPDGEFVQLDAANSHTCGIMKDGKVHCWGLSDAAQPIPTGEFIEVTCGREYSCGLRVDGSLTCWGKLPEGHPAEMPGPYKALSAGPYECWVKGCTQGGMHTCALDPDGAVTCWGEDPLMQASPPPGNFEQIEVAGDRSCALDATGLMTCWGAGSQRPMEGSFVKLALGSHGITCGLRQDGTVNCVFDSPYETEEFASPSHNFTDIHCSEFCCGVTGSGELSCWGNVRR